MVFNSITFLLYFLPAFLLLYSLLGKPYRKLVILSFSILFYLWGAPRFLFGVLISTVLVFYLVRRMDASKTPLHRKILLMLSALISTGMLLMCMCTGHFTDPVRLMMISAEMNFTWWTGTLIPLGISFFTFDAISYSIDVYRKERQPLAKLRDYLTYLLMFPRLIAGPIMPSAAKPTNWLNAMKKMCTPADLQDGIALSPDLPKSFCSLLPWDILLIKLFRGMCSICLRERHGWACSHSVFRSTSHSSGIPIWLPVWAE
jgi:hypothetical protein